MASTLLINSCTFVLLLATSFVSPLSFNLSTIGPDHANRDITLQGDAYISREGLQVTTDERTRLSSAGTGRATYVDPLRLWDNATGNVTDFDTHFSFVIQSASSTACTADGLAFFLAPLNSTIPLNSSGAGLGLAFRNATANVSGSPFVAVEFDTFVNSENDPPSTGPHVGIDVDSLISAAYAPWRNNLTLGRLTDVWISYRSSSKKILVTFTDFVDNEAHTSSIEYTIDMRNYLPEMVSVGFSAATGECFQKNNVKSWSFSSTLELKTPNVTSPLDPSSSSSRPKTKGGKVIGLVAGLCVAALGLVALGYYWIWTRKRGGTNEDEEEEEDVSSMEMDFQKGSGPRRFSYGELAAATNNFAEELKLGEGGFGGVYRGFLKKVESDVAVKRVSKSSKQGAKEYASEVKIISRLRHRNLVQLIGWCHEKRELLLVYELQPNGSLDSHLFNNKSSLSLRWETRYKIARGLASALLYLHQEWEQCVVHRDIKSSNVMLDSGFNAKLGDFGLARLVDHDKDTHTTILAGTMGYMAPECVMTGRASKESDVYSFGIVALEIATGRRAIEGGMRTVEWVWELYGRGQQLEAADPDVVGYEEREMERLMVVGLWCAHPDDTLRPSIKEVVRLLGFEAEPPPLPSKMPVPTYSAPPPTTSVTSLISATSSSTYSYATSSSASSSSALLRST
ncbi:L-type lectin-domain containing receptor kinase IX.1-like [Salvia miltiorrhiza]|uniref:L-type lectin-domain containing receptor kinase IX.1-like n=1 Tax=Salvia miltiorrhiza TaxID=226208 RepID=UPI0025AC0821|nr:L-type lectin-domain containing receptor kinase IX.1-like [Salvia miltiorrhiza]